MRLRDLDGNAPEYPLPSWILMREDGVPGPALTQPQAEAVTACIRDGAIARGRGVVPSPDDAEAVERVAAVLNAALGDQTWAPNGEAGVHARLQRAARAVLRALRGEADEGARQSHL